jgi:hypothetical protein
MSTLAQTRVLPQTLADTWKNITEGFLGSARPKPG